MNETWEEDEEFLLLSTNESWMVPYLFFLLIMGTIGNLFGLVVFRHGSMRKYSCSLYFFLMSIFDEITLIIWITNRLSELLGSGQYRKFSTFLCKFFVVGYYSSAQSSIGMLVLATIDRLYTTYKIAHGCFDVRLLIRRKRFQYICLFIFFLIMTPINAVLFGSQLIFFPGYDEPSCLIINVQITRIYSLIDLCIYAIIPCILMIIGDILILYFIQQTRARVSITKHEINKRREKQLAKMLVITTIVWLFIVSPYSLLNLLLNFSSILSNDFQTLYILYDIFGILSILPHAMHFYLFLVISSTIREHFKIVYRSCSNIYWKRKQSIHPNVISIK